MPPQPSGSQAGDLSLDLTHAREVAVDAARRAGGLLRDRLSSIREIRHKGVVDIVTDVDVASERLISSLILDAFPDHTILGEEGGTQTGNPRHRWIVDPLDGTTNYAHGFPFFCVSIGFETDGELTLGAVYDPLADELFLAQAGQGATLNGKPIGVSSRDVLADGLLATGFPYDRSHFSRALGSFETLSMLSLAVRRAGSAALDMCYVACGRLDGYWEHEVRAWDIAAGTVIVREAGGQVTATDGSPFTLAANQVLASNGLLHSSLADALRGR